MILFDLESSPRPMIRAGRASYGQQERLLPAPYSPQFRNSPECLFSEWPVRTRMFPICPVCRDVLEGILVCEVRSTLFGWCRHLARSEEHTSELQSRFDIVCRLLLEKKKKKYLDCVYST